MKLILISYDKNIKGELELLIQLFEKGLEYFHIRKPAFSYSKMEEYVKKIPEIYRNRLILHSHYELVDKYKLKGIHFTKYTYSLINLYKNRSIHKSISYHSFDEIKSNNYKFDYIFLSPIYNSISKKGYNSAFTEYELLNFFQSNRINQNIIALGGISEKKINNTLDKGFNGAAVLGEIWNSFIKKNDFSVALKKFDIIKTQINSYRPKVLSIAGFDPSAGAGILADIKTFENHKTYGLAVISSNTFQNDNEFDTLRWISIDDIIKQIEVLSRKYYFEYVKIGLIESFDILEKLIDYLLSSNSNIKIVWDTILRASSGFDFHTKILEEKLTKILEKLYLVTPNIIEAKKLFVSIKFDTDYYNLQKQLQQISNNNILIKGGHSDNNKTNDILFTKNGFKIIEGNKYYGYDKHGTGCILSSSIISNLANNSNLTNACINAKKYINKILLSNNSNLAYHS